MTKHTRRTRRALALNRYQRGYYGNMDFITPLIIAGVVFGLLLPVAWKYIVKPVLVWILSLLTGA
jgi:hypothetical protein